VLVVAVAEVARDERRERRLAGPGLAAQQQGTACDQRDLDGQSQLGAEVVHPPVATVGCLDLRGGVAG
jgi:hypothetical protein